jgi:hypothetical protein
MTGDIEDVVPAGLTVTAAAGRLRVTGNLELAAAWFRQLAHAVQATAIAIAQESRPDRCGNCGAGPERLGYDPVDGWSCSACGGSDADETG